MVLRVLAVVSALVHLAFETRLGAFGPFLKAVPVAILGYLVLGAAARTGRSLAAAGLFVSAAADMAIEFSFIAGLGTFLVAHLLYIASFTQREARLRIGRLLPLSVWAVLLLPAMVRHAGGLAIPVAIYGCVIFTMMWRAAAAVNAGGWNPGTILLAGALLFGLSDSLLGWNRFVAPVPGADLLVMLTYWGGQALIATAFLRDV